MTATFHRDSVNRSKCQNCLFQPVRVSAHTSGNGVRFLTSSYSTVFHTRKEPLLAQNVDGVSFFNLPLDYQQLMRCSSIRPQMASASLMVTRSKRSRETLHQPTSCPAGLKLTFHTQDPSSSLFTFSPDRFVLLLHSRSLNFFDKQRNCLKRTR